MCVLCAKLYKHVQDSFKVTPFFDAEYIRTVYQNI